MRINPMTSNVTRRHLLRCAGGAGLAVGVAESAQRRPTVDELKAAAARPILRMEALKSPVKVESIELLKNGRTFLVRARSTDGAEGLAVANDDRLKDTYPIFLNHLAPFFLGKDARELERLQEELYRHNSNYKFQGLAWWVCHAAVEMALLDLLGKLTKKSIGDLLGGVKRRELAVYRASGNRGNTPEQEIEVLQKLIAETGAQALKFRLGGRMSNDADYPPDRTVRLIPLVRKAFGEAMTIYADANSSYNVAKAIEIGRMLEAQRVAFYEEPVRFDHLDETKQVKDALRIPIAWGEQEFSLWGFRWMIANRGCDIVQPDLHYFGGYLRCVRVARMAELAGLPCTLHMSGAGLGYLDVLHFASCIPNPGAHQEFKGESRIPITCETSTLRCVNGIVRVPSGPGFGITVDPDFVRKAERVRGL